MHNSLYIYIDFSIRKYEIVPISYVRQKITPDIKKNAPDLGSDIPPYFGKTRKIGGFYPRFSRI